jgi:outer membrane beta-barrel protein
MKRILLLTMLLTSTLAFAKQKSQSLDNDMDALGGNKDLMERANAIDPHNTVRVIQKREVDRDLRLELGVNYGIVAGGDPFLDTGNLGGRVDFHLDPHWSLGGRYYHSSSKLNSQGQQSIDTAAAFPGSPHPEIDYPRDTYLGTVTFYPFYGKINFADLAIKQFDIYFVGGYGQVSLDQGSQPTYTGGMGFAFWWSNHWSTRLEARYQGYQDKFDDGTSRQMNLTVLTLDIGFLL